MKHHDDAFTEYKGIKTLSFNSTISPPSISLDDYINAPSFVDKISPNDHMFRHVTDVAKYHWVGRSAIESIKALLNLENKTNVNSILDFGCGHGRVCRALRAAYPNSLITVCDLNCDAVDFCARAFDATPVYSTENINDIALPGGFDLIWVGSVFSHLNRKSWLSALELFRDNLVKDGLLIGSVEGPFSFRHLLTGGPSGLTSSGVDQIKENYEREGFGFAPYKEGVSKYATIGRTFVTPAWVQKTLKQAGFRCFAMVERGYGGLQDVFGSYRTTAT